MGFLQVKVKVKKAKVEKITMKVKVKIFRYSLLPKVSWDWLMFTMKYY